MDGSYCLDLCPKTSIIINNNELDKKGCITCNTAIVYDNECLESCPEGTYLNILKDSCIEDCDPAINKECVPNYNNGYYFNAETKKCNKCPDSKPYKCKNKLTCYSICPGPKGFYNIIYEYCDKCNDNDLMNIKTFTCEPSCYSDFTKHNDLGICEDCYIDKKYFNPESNSCSFDCPSNYYKDEIYGCIENGKWKNGLRIK